MEFYEYDDPLNEIYHHGIKGQKWGIRRFQNKDGSLTAKGGKRYNGSDYKPRKSIGERISEHRTAVKRKNNLKKARAAREEKKRAAAEELAKAEQRKKDIAAGKIKAKDMTESELKDRINRLNDEKRYNQLMEETGHNSKIESYGKKFVNKMWNEAVQPALVESGRKMLTDKISEAIKKNTPVEEFDLDKFWKNRNKMSTQQIMDVNKRLTAEDQIKKKMDDRKSRI